MQYCSNCGMGTTLVISFDLGLMKVEEMCNKTIRSHPMIQDSVFIFLSQFFFTIIGTSLIICKDTNIRSKSPIYGHALYTTVDLEDQSSI